MSTKNIIAVVAALLIVLGGISLLSDRFAGLNNNEAFIIGVVSKADSGSVVVKNGEYSYEMLLSPSTQIVRKVNVFGKLVDERATISDVEVDMLANIRFKTLSNGELEAMSIEIR